MTIEAWPSVLVPQRCNPTLRSLSTSGGRTLTGREQRVISDAGFWSVEMAGIRVARREQAAAFRAMIARLRQGEDILLPVFDVYRPVGAKAPVSAAQLARAHALRSTRLDIQVSGIDVQAGHHLTIGDRMYLVTRIVSGPLRGPVENQVAHDSPWSDAVPWRDEIEAAAAYTVDIVPPLRADLSAGERARFRDLLVRCVLANVSDGDLDLDLLRLGSASLTFVESV